MDEKQGNFLGKFLTGTLNQVKQWFGDLGV